MWGLLAWIGARMLDENEPRPFIFRKDLLTPPHAPSTVKDFPSRSSSVKDFQEKSFTKPVL